MSVQVALVGAAVPKLVQITATAVPAGVPYTVEGFVGDHTWPVRGGSGVGEGTNVILADNRTPINTPLQYRVNLGDDVTWESAPITVPYAGKYVLQSLDGRSAVEVRWMDNGLPWDAEVRSAAFAVAGRPRPVLRLEASGAGGGELEVKTSGMQTRALVDLLSTGQPIVVRTDGDVRDFPPVEVVLPTRVSSTLTGERIQEGDVRLWALPYLLVDDPEPNTRIATSTWNDFDTVYAGLTWDDFDAQWSGATWDDFDRFDWAGQA